MSNFHFDLSLKFSQREVHHFSGEVQKFSGEVQNDLRGGAKRSQGRCAPPRPSLKIRWSIKILIGYNINVVDRWSWSKAMIETARVLSFRLMEVMLLLKWIWTRSSMSVILVHWLDWRRLLFSKVRGVCLGRLSWKLY
jgi:hypothetical protein